jgi:hypothetical protein
MGGAGVDPDPFDARAPTEAKRAIDKGGNPVMAARKKASKRKATKKKATKKAATKKKATRKKATRKKAAKK